MMGCMGKDDETKTSQKDGNCFCAWVIIWKRYEASQATEVDGRCLSPPSPCLVKSVQVQAGSRPPVCLVGAGKVDVL